MVMTEDQIIEAVISGDKEAANFIIEEYYKLIYSYIYKLTQDYHISYDLTQEVFIKAIRAIKQYKHKGKLKGWLLTIASNSVKDYFRKEKGEKLEFYDSYIDREDDTSVISLRRIEREEDNKKLKEVIDTLSIEMKEVIILRYFYDMKIREISEITGSKETTIKTRLRRALKYLNIKLIGGVDDGKKVN